MELVNWGLPEEVNTSAILRARKRKLLRTLVIRLHMGGPIGQCFSTAGPRPGVGPWHQLYRAARGSPGICNFSFLSIFHE